MGPAMGRLAGSFIFLQEKKPFKNSMKNQTHEELLARVAELQAEISFLKKRKKYGLVWEDKPEEFEKNTRNAFPILKEKGDNFQDVISDEYLENNILIEGDNYHSLSVLAYTHKGKIDLIYIDPPYNTGAKDWKYNNDYVDADDPWKHTKWLSMMKKRLVLAKSLLNKTGSLICAIDDYELNTLGLLLDEIFPSYEKNLIIVEHHPQGAGSVTISRTHEYAYILTPKGLGIRGRKENDTEGRWSLRRSGQGENNWRENRPNQFFSIIVDSQENKIIGVGPSISKEEKKYPQGNTKEGYLRIYPIDKNGGERVWRYNRETMKKLIEKGDIEYTERGSLVVKKSGVAAAPIFSVWTGSRYNAGTYGTNFLMEALGKLNTFPYPKSLYTVLDMIEMIVKDNKNALILDFFAGSGTTGHAVLELNKDGGERRFILCTNNEGGICEDVTFPRIKKIIQGFKSNKSSKVEGLGGNLKYLKTDFIPKDIQGLVTDEDRLRLTYEAGLLLALKEDTFTEIKKTKSFQIFSSTKKITGVYFSENKDDLSEFLEILNSSEKESKAYIFSWDKGAYKNAFPEFDHTIFEDIPEPILEVYKQLV